MRKILLNIVLSLGAGFLGGYSFFYFNPPVSPQFQKTEFTESDSNGIATFTSTPSRSAIYENIDFSNASKISTECVVYIKTISKQDVERYSWFDMYFYNRQPQRRVAGSGSGVIFSKDGFIVTNNHVIDGADEIEVIFNKKSYRAELIGTDPSTDLALLKIDGKNLPFIKVASSKTLNVGEWVLAVGNPFNLQSTVTAGIVSAKGRRINILEDIFPIESFIQTDAAINPGNSGGALVNLDGHLVGINTAILSRTGSYAGYGFAVPSDIVTKVVSDLKQYGEVQKAFIGAEVVDLDEDLSNQLGTSDLDGVVVTFIEPEGAAAQVGIEKGDIIVEINENKINSRALFDEQLGFYRPGDKIKIKYKRGKENYVKDIILTNVEGTTGIVKKITYNAEKLGATFEVVPKMERTRLGIESGIRVKQVERGLINNMDIKEGEVIVAINNYKIEKPEDLEEILIRIRGRVIVEVIDRDNKKRYYSYRF
ncbi:S1C family serine protease [Flexithrix dorotheae]|uniref:S1C family serine protease n=1 Tax=Flexithrix dorotheae TaxID=70993 RepID=UPI00035ED3D4|nr:trypsin-like peptidase domain-containing protein [Flexithrix dorotheae]